MLKRISKYDFLRSKVVIRKVQKLHNPAIEEFKKKIWWWYLGSNFSINGIVIFYQSVL